ncbi:hypothetical protein ACFXP7_00865 [Microbacterium sp. P06]|uniref:hypothetical protein n=1 Tax=Microbacterium sp. P06 TaxID=3366949 RepID=UPI00374701AB
MALTAPIALVTKHSRDMPTWAAAVLAVAGNILIVAIIATAAALVVGAAALVFGTALLATI